jgi:tRNA1(Val) A37 N6-methylase TrmN6
LAKADRRKKNFPAIARNDVLENLNGLGFLADTARKQQAQWNGDCDVVRYDTFQKGSREPYLTVVVHERFTVPDLFSELPPSDLRSEYMAFTNGSQWFWYHQSVNGAHLEPLDGPPPPPASPPGHRWLEPIKNKREFKNILRTMNVALRDSRGGGIVERFDVIGKVLFTKVFDEREVYEGEKDQYEFYVGKDDTLDSVSSRVSAVWHRACSKHRSLYRGRIPELTEDQPALYRIAQILQDVSLRQTRGDIKGLAYEEILRNTFDKNENQQFFTPSEVVEFVIKMVEPKGNELICDPACGTGGFLVEAFLNTSADATLVGADVDERLAHVAQMNLIMHGSDRATVHHLPGTGSLAPLRDIETALQKDSFELILTNPPFGSDLSDEPALREFETGRGRASRRRSVLFTERCLDLLCPGGRMAIVLDDGVLNLPSSSDVRSMTLERAVVEAVISLPDVTFMPYSTAKSSILLLRKKLGSEPQGPIFMAEAHEVGRRPNGDPLFSEDRDEEGNRVLLSDLPDITSAYAAYKENGNVEHPKCFVTPASLLSDRLDIYHYHPKRFAAEEEIRSSRWPTPALKELVQVRRDTIKPAEIHGDSPVRWLGLGDIEEGTGEFDIKVVVASKIKSAAHVFNGGDLLFSKLRPNLRKVALISDDEEGGVCSGEIIVLRGFDKVSDNHSEYEEGAGLEIDSEYLAFMLRSDLVYGQLMYKVTGVGRPRVSLDAILSVKLPLPPLEEQKRIVDIFNVARSESVEARHKAASWMARSKEVVDEAYHRVIAELTTNLEGAK